MVFFSAYWTAIVGLLASLGTAVVRGQTRFWSPPPGTHRIERRECLARIETLTAELDAGIAASLRVADEVPPRALPAFRRFAADWETRWRRVRYGCGLDRPDAAARPLAAAHDRLLERRYSAESVVRRYAASEGRDRARLADALARARDAS
jgi:hypothetical protein